MCVVISKYFDKKGWVLIKQRDRNYSPEISFKTVNNDDLEILYFWDNNTQYCEGINSNGISILSASLMVIGDEKEISTKEPSKDGKRIQEALTYSTLEDACKFLISSKLTGHTLICDKDRCFLLEGAWKKGGYRKEEFEYDLREIPKDEIIVRTNHGIKLKHAGYQTGMDIGQEDNRISSEIRRSIVISIAKLAKTPTEIMDNLLEPYMANPQLNPTRLPHKDKKMRTTSQIVLIPSDSKMIVRILDGKLDKDIVYTMDKITLEVVD